jgi:hypothetical protein
MTGRQIFATGPTGGRTPWRHLVVCLTIPNLSPSTRGAVYRFESFWADMKNAENLSASAIWRARGPVEVHPFRPADVRLL